MPAFREFDITIPMKPTRREADGSTHGGFVSDARLTALGCAGTEITAQLMRRGGLVIHNTALDTYLDQDEPHLSSNGAFGDGVHSHSHNTLTRQCLRKHSRWASASRRRIGPRTATPFCPWEELVYCAIVKKIALPALVVMPGDTARAFRLAPGEYRGGQSTKQVKETIP